MRGVIFLFILALLCLAGIAQAQPDMLWLRTYGGERDENCQSIIQTSDGGFALAGYLGSFEEDDSLDFWLVKTDRDGEELWSQTYISEGQNGCNSAILTSDGRFALAGSTQSLDNGLQDFWLVVTDDEGEEIWSQTYGEEGGDLCQSVIQTSDGGFALAGSTLSLDNENGFDILLVRTDEDGGELWSHTYYNQALDICNSVIQVSDGGFVLVGITDSTFFGGGDFWMVRTDRDGEELWSRTYDGFGDGDACNSIVQTAEGCFVLAGHSTSPGADGVDFWLIGTGEEGEEI